MAMKGTRGVLLAAAMVISLSGCGTVCNLTSRDPDNYGGVQRDLKFADDATANGGLLSGASGGGGGTGDGWAAVFVLALYGADLTLSIVGDTLTLPLAAYLRHRHEAATD
jgi:uncharacterized protein YceK